MPGNFRNILYVFKQTGKSVHEPVNLSSTKAQAIFDYAVFYPNPYLTITPDGYTKHYYLGSERIATAIGEGGRALSNGEYIPYNENSPKPKGIMLSEIEVIGKR